MEEKNNKSYEVGFAIHELALHAKDIYKSPKATEENKRLLLTYAFSELTLKDGIISAKYTEAFEFLKTHLPALNATFEQVNNGLHYSIKGAIQAPHPVLLPGSDSNRRPID